MQFQRTQLDNGLEVLAESNPEAHSAAVAFFVKTGSRDEPPELAGVSHFLEHMTFKGTPTRSAAEINRAFDAMGAYSNASTSKETTIYFATLLPEYVEAAIELLADMMRPALREEDFATEKQVILEEIRMYEDEPPFGAFDKCEALHFSAHPLAHSVLGTVDSIAALSADAMRAYFQRRYSPRNMLLLATGRIDFAAVTAAARRYCGQWQPFGAGRTVTAARRQGGFKSYHKPAAVQQHIIQLAAGPALDRRERFAADAAACILGDPTGSRLFWALVESGEADHATLGFYEYQGAGIFATSVSCLPEKTEGNLLKTSDLYRRAEREGVSETELNQAKNKAKSRIVLNGERPMGRLGAVGGNWVQWGEYLSVRDEIEAVDAVTLDEVNAVLRKYPLNASTTVTVGPLERVTPPNGE